LPIKILLFVENPFASACCHDQGCLAMPAEGIHGYVGFT